MDRKLLIPFVAAAVLGGAIWLDRDDNRVNLLLSQEDISAGVRGVLDDDSADDVSAGTVPVEPVEDPTPEPAASLPERPAILDEDPEGCHVSDDAVVAYWKAVEGVSQEEGDRVFDEIMDPCNNEGAEEDAKRDDILETASEVMDFVESDLRAKDFEIIPVADNPLVFKFRRSDGVDQATIDELGSGDVLAQALSALSEESFLFMGVEYDEDGAPIYSALYEGNTYVGGDSQELAGELLGAIGQ